MGDAGYIARHVNYFRGKAGHEFALVFEGEVLDVGLGDRKWAKALERADLVGLISKAPKTTWGGMVPMPGGMSYVCEKPTKGEAAEAVRARAAAIGAEGAKEAADPVYALEKALKAHDWYAHYSDDNGVFFASERHWDKIKELLALVAPEVGASLVAKYKPA